MKDKHFIRKSTTIATPLLAALLSSSTLFASGNVSADHRDYRQERHRQYARVTHVEPVYRTVKRRVPVEQCWIETVEHERRVDNHRSRRATLIGGLIGAAVGSKISARHHIDQRNGHIGVIAGSLIGASIGHEAGKKHRRDDIRVIESRDIERCETTHQTRREEQLIGYDVSYRHHGRIYRTHTKEHPGRKIHVRESFRRSY